MSPVVVVVIRCRSAWPRSGDGMDQAVVCKNVATRWLGLRFEVSQDEVPWKLAFTLTYRLPWRQARPCSRRRTGCWPSPRLARRYQVASKSYLWHQELRVAVQALASPAGARDITHQRIQGPRRIGVQGRKPKSEIRDMFWEITFQLRAVCLSQKKKSILACKVFSPKIGTRGDLV